MILLIPADRQFEGIPTKLKFINHRTAMLGLSILLSAGCHRESSLTPNAPATVSSSAAKAESNRPRMAESSGSHVRHLQRPAATSEWYSDDRRDVNGAAVPVKGRSKLRSAEIVGGTAAVGAAIGALAGGGKAAAIGALAGGGAALVYDRATAHKNTSR